MDSVVPALGVVRIAIGAALLVRPGGLVRAVGVTPDAAGPAAALAAMTGARELAIGLGTVRAWRRGDATDGWVAAQAVSDTADTVLFARAARRGDVPAARGWGLALFALSGAVSEGLAAWGLRNRL